MVLEGSLNIFKEKGEMVGRRGKGGWAKKGGGKGRKGGWAEKGGQETISTLYFYGGDGVNFVPNR